MTKENMCGQEPEIRVILKEPGKEPRMEKIPNTLEALQEAVGGYIETVTLFADLCVICNEEGRILGLPHCCKVLGLDLVGTILLVGVNGEEFADVPMDMETARRLLPELWEGLSATAEEAPSPESEGKDETASSTADAVPLPLKGKVFPKLEEMTRLELNDLLLEQLDKLPGMDVNLVKAAIREVNRKEAAEAVELDAAIEDYKRRVANREPFQIPEAERGELQDVGLTILERIALRQAADLGVKALLAANEITTLEALNLVGVERMVKAIRKANSRDKWE